MIRYRIQPTSPHAHLFTIQLHLPQTTPEGQVLRMPAWIPGSYMIRDFARQVVSFRAQHADGPVAFRKLDKDSWQLEPVSGAVDVTIEVYAWDLSVRSAHLDNTHGYFNGTSVFLQPLGFEDQPMEVAIVPPEGAAYATWLLATGMPRVSGDEWEFGTFRADNYDALIDYPVEMGNFEYGSFDACGVKHRVVVSGHRGFDMNRLLRDLKPVCEYQLQFFQDEPPISDYLFMTLVTDNGYGGLEHRNSTSLMCSRQDLPRFTDKPDQFREPYRTYLGLCSHEYFHTWNVKRIKPDAFVPYDLARENYTEQLWSFEGFTSYYDDLVLVRTGKLTVAQYLEGLGQTISRVMRGKGVTRQSVAESSFDAWTRFYKQDENSPNAIVSYYAKGTLVALCLDLLIRRETGHEKSLDDVMRALWQQYGRTGIGVPDDGVQKIAETLVGHSLNDFFLQALYSTEPLPLAELLATVGVQVHWRAPESHADNGGKPGRAEPPVWLGARFADDPQGLKVSVVFDDGALMQAGVAAGDIIIAINELKADTRKLEDQLSQFVEGDELVLHAFRRDQLYKTKVTLLPAPATLAWLELDPGTDAANRWLQPPV